MKYLSNYQNVIKGKTSLVSSIWKRTFFFGHVLRLSGDKFWKSKCENSVVQQKNSRQLNHERMKQCIYEKSIKIYMMPLLSFAT